MEYSSLEINYRHISRLLNEALKQWHPDVNKDERAEAVTIFLIKVKEQADKCYRMLTKGGAS